MPIRRHRRPGLTGSAVFSDCGAYRYALSRRWGAGPLLGMVLLNPSTADAGADDPTVARAIARARRLGFGGLRLVNLFALRSPHPQALRRAADPVGPDTDAIMRRALRGTAAILCGWGEGGALQGRDRAVLARLRSGRRPLWHLGLTRAGRPRHPLYIPASKAPELWADPASPAAAPPTAPPSPPAAPRSPPPPVAAPPARPRPDPPPRPRHARPGSRSPHLPL